VVKPGKEEEARVRFPELKIVGSHHYLGGSIGSPDANAGYVKRKSQKMG